MLVDRFFVWVTEASVDQRRRAVDALVRAYFAERTAEDDHEAIEAALTLVAEDADLSVRRALAEHLAGYDDAPRHLLLGLVWDHPDVALPIVTRSDALIDAELVDLAAGADGRIQAAIARRRRVGATVATALAEAGEREAVIALLANTAADIPAAALERMVERFGEFADLREALMGRAGVPITVRHRVLEKLAEAMGNLVVVQDWMRPDRAADVTRAARDKATVALAAAAGEAEIEVLVEHLRRTGQLTTALLLRAACVGNLRFVEEALARLAGQPMARVAALVAEGRESAFRALYLKAGMPARAFPAFAAAVEVHRDLLRETGGWDGSAGDRARFARRLVERVLTRVTGIDRRDSDDLLAMLRRFAADAARDHVRALVAERTADAVPLLIDDREGVEREVPDFDLAAFGLAPVEDGVPEAGRLDVVPTSPLRHDDAAFFAVDAGWDEAGVVRAEADAVAAPEDFDEDDCGLFSNLCLDDVPPEWLVDDGGVVDVFGEGAVLRPSFDAASPQGAREGAISFDFADAFRGGFDTARAA